MAERYGDADLRMDTPDAATAPYVQALTSDLLLLGFPIGDVGTVFDRPVEIAVREFQYWARVGKAALDPQNAAVPPTIVEEFCTLLARLEPVTIANTDRYPGPISGVVERKTKDALARWLRNGWRCPVLFVGYREPKHKPRTLLHWRWYNGTTLINPAPAAPKDVVIYCFDYARATSRFDPDAPERAERLGRVELGRFVEVRPPQWGPAESAAKVYRDKEKNKDRKFEHWGGPIEKLGSKVTPITRDSLFGPGPYSDKEAQAQSTFRVIRAIAEVETRGLYEAFNAYDRNGISIGPYHHTLVTRGSNSQTDPVEAGELGAFIALVEAKFPDAFRRTFASWGMAARPAWGTGRDAGLWDAKQRTYGALPTLERNPHEPPEPVGDNGSAERFRSWHWAWRLVWAMRTDGGLQQAMGVYTRLRLSDLLSLRWGSPPKNAAWPNDVRLGHVFTSEMAVALLLRMHVFAPKSVVSSGLRGTVKSVVEAMAKTQAWARSSPLSSAWDDAQEKLLVEALISKFVLTSSAGAEGLKTFMELPQAVEKNIDEKKRNTPAKKGTDQEKRAKLEEEITTMAGKKKLKNESLARLVHWHHFNTTGRQLGALAWERRSLAFFDRDLEGVLERAELWPPTTPGGEV